MCPLVPVAFKSPFGDAGDGRRAFRFGMTLFLISLGVLFAATVAGLLVVRIQLTRKSLWPDDLPMLPRGLLVGTAILIVSSVTMHFAVSRARARAAGAAAGPLVRLLLATAALGLGFLAAQAWCWVSWLGPVGERWAESEEWRIALSGFYVLTGLHGAHVLGGLIALAFTTWRAALGRYHVGNHGGVDACGMYWHFLGVVWLVLYALLLIGS